MEVKHLVICLAHKMLENGNQNNHFLGVLMKGGWRGMG